MIGRYRDAQITRLFGVKRLLELWTDIEQTVLNEQRKTGIVPDLPIRFNTPGAAVVSRVEESTQHDVAAFVEVIRSRVEPGHRGYVHLGLTSSDLVDTGLAMTLRPVRERIGSLSYDLGLTLRDLADRHRGTLRLGRTHGQPAEPTVLGLTFLRFEAARVRAVARWSTVVPGKLSGPVGLYSPELPPALEARVLGALEVQLISPVATQVVPRDYIAAWASELMGLVRVCDEIATEVRLCSHAQVGEARWARKPGEIGSSSMPHKSNPAVAEKITGLTRVAAGYVSALQHTALWHERDISNSSVERIALVDLCHLAAHVLAETRRMLERTAWDDAAMLRNLDDAGVAPHTRALVAYLTVPRLAGYCVNLDTAVEIAQLAASYRRDPNDGLDPHAWRVSRVRQAADKFGVGPAYLGTDDELGALLDHNRVFAYVDDLYRRV